MAVGKPANLSEPQFTHLGNGAITEPQGENSRSMESIYHGLRHAVSLWGYLSLRQSLTLKFNNPMRNTFFLPTLRQGQGMGGMGARGCRDSCLEPEILFSPIICFQSLISFFFFSFLKLILPKNKHVSVRQLPAQSTYHPLGISALNAGVRDPSINHMRFNLHTFARAGSPPCHLVPCALGLF